MDSVVSIRRRFSSWLPRSFWIGLMITMFSLPAAGAGDRSDDDDDSPPDAHFEDAEATVDSWISDANAAHHNLEMLLRQRIAFVDRVCGLTDSQKQKLELVMRGDLKRLLDRVEARRLEPGASTESSLVAKVLEKILTAVQRERYEPLRMVIHAGGRIQTEEPESGEVLEIDLQGTAFADDGSRHFSDFPGLVRLFLGNTKVSDDGLAHLKGLMKLEWLDIAGTRVTDAGLKNLNGLTHLQWLSLARTRVDGSGLVHLKGLARLQSLNLESTQVTDAGLSHLQGLTKLERLCLNNTQVTDVGVARLQRALPKLTIKGPHSDFRGIQAQGAMGGGFF